MELEGGISIRPAREGDLASLLDLYRELEGPYSDLADGKDPSPEVYRAVFYKILADKNQTVLLAEGGGIAAGTVTLVIVPNLGHRARPWAAVENLVVRGDFRGRGFGKALLAGATDIACDAGCYKAVLSSNVNRTGSHLFYKKLGWRLTHYGFEILLK